MRLWKKLVMAAAAAVMAGGFLLPSTASADPIPPCERIPCHNPE